MIRTATDNDREIWLKLRKIVYTDCTDDFHEEDINIWMRDDDKECFFLFPEFRGQGLSKELMAVAEDWMRDKGCTEMGSDADLENEKAIQFHQAIGFEETFRIVQFKKKL
ncbi:MAG: GNAT family N-acetyltransferase [Rubripirellula sp.]|nr:GNAT family N-acetyltransferase [Rubripirellula sp.]